MHFIGIAGSKRSGKDTIARMIGSFCEEGARLPWTRRAFADALKAECAEMLATFKGDRESILNAMHNDRTKESYRLLLQWWGTEFRRRMCGQDYWVSALDAWVDRQDFPKNMVILVPDIRFPNECEFIQKQPGGVLINVVRPSGGENLDLHASEVSLAGRWTEWDKVIINDGTKDDLNQKVVAFAAQWFRG